jgi:hypothetical protein
MRRLVLGICAFALAALATASAFSPASKRTRPPDDERETAAWREKRERDLRSATGWLTVVGLFFLKTGVNTVGADPASDVVLPDGIRSTVGSIIKTPDDVWFEPAADTAVNVNDRAVTTRVRLGRSDRVSVGRVTFYLHASGDRLAVRVRDPESALRREFRGLRWYPIRPSWRIVGHYVPYAAPRPISLPNVLGDDERYVSPGEVEFEVNGKTVRLQPVSSGERLWFIFTDTTADRETYRVRFLSADAPSPSGAVVLDFNRAYNPPCAYNPHTTCPLPPQQNRLTIPIDAGEKNYSSDFRFQR